MSDTSHAAIAHTLVPENFVDEQWAEERLSDDLIHVDASVLREEDDESSSDMDPLDPLTHSHTHAHMRLEGEEEEEREERGGWREDGLDAFGGGSTE
jgi:hypothetical protein